MSRDIIPWVLVILSNEFAYMFTKNKIFKFRGIDYSKQQRLDQFSEMHTWPS